jgi:hypothetical protein
MTKVPSYRRAWPKAIPVLLLLLAVFALFTGDQAGFWMGIVGALGALAWLALRGAVPGRTMYDSLLVYATLLWLGGIGFAVFATWKFISFMFYDPPLTAIAGLFFIALVWMFPVLWARLVLLRMIRARPGSSQRA